MFRNNDQTRKANKDGYLGECENVYREKEED